MSTIYKMYSVRDAKTETYNPPWYKLTHGQAERDFKTMTNDSKSPIYQYPEDFDLYYVGEYNESNGKLSSLDTPQHVAKAISMKDPT